MNYSPEVHEDSFDHEMAEKLLSERLENITESIQPSLGYEIQLEGVQTDNPVVWGALERYFDTLLDIDSGAQLTLDYDPLVDRLSLKELRIDTSGQNGPVYIRRTQAGYIPIQTISTAEILYSKDGSLEITGQASDPIKPQFGERILESFGLENIPHNESTQYQLWLSQTLANTRAWRLTESTEIPLVLTDNAAQSLTLKKETVVGESPEDFFVTRSLTESITLADAQNADQTINESVLELSGDIGQSHLRYSLSDFRRTPDLLVPDIFSIDEKHEVVVPIKEAEYSRLKKKLEEVALLKYQLSKLD